jgi:L-ascorbate metabolism protein UlaG (beta-lactamase superfamily)
MPENTTITWYGHATWGVRTPGGADVLIDPWLATNPACPAELHGASADLVLVTHGHGDHVTDAVSVAQRGGAPIVAQYELALWLAEQGAPEVIGMNTGGAVEAKGLRITMTPAFHSAGIVQGSAVVGYGGDPVGYVIELEHGQRIYVAGDTCVFGDMALIRELYAPVLAILPVGDLFTMGPLQAAHAVRLLGVEHVLCSHWGTFDALTGTPALLREELARLGLGEVAVHDLAPGEAL